MTAELAGFTTITRSGLELLLSQEGVVNLQNKFHFLANYEYEREPRTATFSSPFPRFNVDVPSTRTEKKRGLRLDSQFSSQTRLAVRGNEFKYDEPYSSAGGAAAHPSNAISIVRSQYQLLATLTRVLGNRAVNEVKGGYAGFAWGNFHVVNWPDNPMKSIGVTPGEPQVLLRGYTIGTSFTAPMTQSQDNYSVRDDFTYSFTKLGHHDVKLGGEYLYQYHSLFSCRQCMGVIDATNGQIPANIEDLFPVWNHVTTWNLAALSPITRQYTQGIGNFRYYVPRRIYGSWVQDDWKITPRVTLNLGLRYDLETNVWANNVSIPPWVDGNRPNDTNNIGPRLGFAFSPNDRTVLRGGFGKYFAQVIDQVAQQTTAYTQIAAPSVLNDGRSNFAANPFNGPAPDYARVISTSCPVTPGPSCLRLNISSGTLASNDLQTPYSYQTSVGMQRQLAETMSVEADYVYIGSRAEQFT